MDGGVALRGADRLRSIRCLACRATYPLDLRELAEEKATLESAAYSDLDEEEIERLVALQELESQFFNGDVAEYAGNESTLIPDWEFDDYCEELAYDIGVVERDSTIAGYVDWER